MKTGVVTVLESGEGDLPSNSNRSTRVCVLSLFLFSITAHAQTFYCDSGSALYGGSVFQVSASGPSLVTAGNKLIQPLDIAVSLTGNLIISDPGKIVRVDAVTGIQTVIAQNWNTLGSPFGICVDTSGDVIIANGYAIVRLGQTGGKVKTVASGGNVTLPVDVAVSDGYYYALDVDYPPAIVRINPRSGSQLVVTDGGLLRSPQGLAVYGGYAYITDMIALDGSFGAGRVLRVHIQTGAQSTVSSGGLLVGPVGITVEPDGKLLVADPYVINSASVDLYDGGIVRVDPSTGQQTLIVRGSGDNVNPVGVTTRP